MNLRVEVDGKFFSLAGRPFRILGVTYGPFPPDEAGYQFRPREQTRLDFQEMVSVGVNSIRLYTIPPEWLIDLAKENKIRILVDIPWNPHQAFLGDRKVVRDILNQIGSAAKELGKYSNVIAISIANEIPPQSIRWHGRRKVESFLETAFDIAKQSAPETLVTFANYPSTEYLHPVGMDFTTCNVYLHQASDFERYLRRIHHRCGAQPLLIGEIGMDSLREGETTQATFLDSQLELAFRSGAAGCFVFSWTDLWWKQERWVENWNFGITDREGNPKAASHSVQSHYKELGTPLNPDPDLPMVSVVVATHNGERYLKECLTSLTRLDYPNYEILVIDDGSSDNTAGIAKSFSAVRYFHQHKAGLSSARNLGIEKSRGVWVAFIDDDCYAPESWLRFALRGLKDRNWEGIGGPNFPPKEDGVMATAVHLSPGAPTHVLLTDEIAEHIPGCNMIFRKEALQAIGGFNPVFKTAGDDVDICWRLQESGATIGFSGAAFVWHHRRDTVKAYLRQQSGYGKAEAALEIAHPGLFDGLGRSLWKGSLYEGGGSWNPDDQGPIYGGPFGSAGFQLVYQSIRQRTWNPIQQCQIETWFLLHIPCWILGFAVPWFFAASALLASYHFIRAWSQIPVRAIPPEKRRIWIRPLISWLRFIHPVYRGLSRYKERWNLSQTPQACLAKSIGAFSATNSHWKRGSAWDFYTYSTVVPDRFSFLNKLKTQWQSCCGVVRLDDGWSQYDMTALGDFWLQFKVNTLIEYGDFEGGILRVKIQPGLRPPGLYLFVIWILISWSLYLTALLPSALLSVAIFLPILSMGIWLKNRADQWRVLFHKALESSFEPTTRIEAVEEDF